MAIRYDKGLQKELRSAVSNFNQKIARLEKLDNNLYLPERASVRRIKSEASSRAELKRMIASLRRYSKRGAEATITTSGGVSTSRYELEETSRNLRRVKSALTRQINKMANIKPTVFGVPQSATYSQMGNEQLANLRARRYSLEVPDIKKLTKEALTELQKRIDFNIQKMKYQREIFMNNYTNKMLLNLGYYVGYDKEKMEIIREKLTKLDEKQFMELFNTDLTIQAIRDYYPESSRAYGNPNYIKDEVTALYDQLYDNIDSMILDYMK